MKSAIYQQGYHPFHICILGPSGIGRTNLARLFKFPGLDPFRVRAPRNAKDRNLCIRSRLPPVFIKRK